MKHPSHTTHPLVLIPSPTYCSGSFFCNACGAPGNAFSYCCPLCEVDLHVSCAFLPPKVTHKSHHHEICLSFRTPDRANSPDYCKVCREELSCGNWSYFCEQPECDFRIHTFCATSEVKPGLYQDDRPTVNENTSVYQAHVRTELTPEEVMLEMSRLQMEFQMTQALSDVKPGLYQDDRPTVNENTSVYQAHVRTELTPEEVMLEMPRLQMEFQMTQAVSDVIAYFPR
ncbi:hypothetical protein CDL12_23851 [Handroanthus impetiginosus]|uniref:DC1 domain-containing protein n=1 Tax=Handroanthus impetiginosus TaxID=429701 RepID=A0A2G9GEJ0_9LAMI|nr:hypothetical protein CDL12_23851 [Handroanthus impetiginosus]